MIYYNYTSNIQSLLSDKDLVDVLIVCEGQHLDTHKVILSARSTFFKYNFNVRILLFYFFKWIFQKIFSLVDRASDRAC